MQRRLILLGFEGDGVPKMSGDMFLASMAGMPFPEKSDGVNLRINQP
jgi:hypothetical protein